MFLLQDTLESIRTVLKPHHSDLVAYQQTNEGEAVTMAKMNDAFLDFNDAIKLSEGKLKEIRGSRNAVRASTRKWMSDNGHGAVNFHMQGSIAMNTAVNPIEDDEYDIDDGIYLSKYEDAPESEWPKPITAHQWVKDALASKTTSEPEDKNACVRVVYKHGYHIDVPIYVLKNGRAYLAHKRDGWVNSDAKDFQDWFSKECKPNGGQLRRIVRYLKRWKDENRAPLKGIELTILAADNYERADGRDDDALRYTVGNVIESLETSFVCRKPVAPWEDLFADASDSKKEEILTALRKLRKTLKKASEAASEKEAADKLRKELGEDFPEGDDSKRRSNNAVTASPAVLRRDGRSG